MSKVKKEYKELLSILDEILSYLVNNTDNYKVSFYKMSEDVFKIEKETANSTISTATTFEAIVEEIFSNFKKPRNKINDLRLAIVHLHNEGLITIDLEYNIEITFKGLLSYSEGIVSKWNSSMSISQRLQNIQEEQLKQNSRVSRYTMWIMIGALVAIFYQVIEILKTFFPCWFCKFQ